MLEHVPGWLGALLHNVRAGASKLTIVDPALGSFASLDLASLAFADGQRLPERFTADGEGASPPLTWAGAPEGARLALIVEDPDAPTSQPVVHAVVADLVGPAGRLEEGGIVKDAAEADVGRNSAFRKGWLPPDPPNGHGEHRYVFQLFALDIDAPDPGEAPGRAALVEAMRGHVLATGVLVGTYSRGELKPVGPVGAVQPA